MNSTGILYIDCPIQDEYNSFTPEKELTEEEYIKMLRDYSTTIGAPLNNNQQNKRWNIYDIEKNTLENKNNYSKAKVNIFDISGNPCDIKELYRLEKKGMGILIINIDDTEMEDSFESEFKFWKKDSMNINNDKEINKDDKIRFLPIKDLKFEIDEHMFLLSGCKLCFEYDRLKVALIIQNVKEI